jgi:hypothetical protein
MTSQTKAAIHRSRYSYRSSLSLSRGALTLATAGFWTLMLVSLPQSPARGSEKITGTPAVETTAVTASEDSEAGSTISGPGVPATALPGIALDGYEDR